MCFILVRHLFFGDLCCIIFRHVHGFCLFVFLYFPNQEAYAGGKCYQSAKQICYRVGKVKTAVGDKYKGAAYHGHEQCGYQRNGIYFFINGQINGYCPKCYHCQCQYHHEYIGNILSTCNSIYASSGIFSIGCSIGCHVRGSSDMVSNIFT